MCEMTSDPELTMLQGVRKAVVELEGCIENSPWEGNTPLHRALIDEQLHPTDMILQT